MNESLSSSGKTDYNKIREILMKNFSYGLKLDFIGLKRFRQFADEMKILLPESYDDLRKILESSGTLIDGKIYYTPENLWENPQNLIAKILSEGHEVIFYDALFENEFEKRFRYITIAKQFL